MLSLKMTGLVPFSSVVSPLETSSGIEPLLMLARFGGAGLRESA